MKKEMTDEQLADLGRECSRMLEAAAAAWVLGMKVLPIKSKEYQSIRRAGRSAQDLYQKIRDIAIWEREWPQDQVKAIFTVEAGYGWG